MRLAACVCGVLALGCGGTPGSGEPSSAVARAGERDEKRAVARPGDPPTADLRSGA